MQNSFKLRLLSGKIENYYWNTIMTMIWLRNIGSAKREAINKIVTTATTALYSLRCPKYFNDSRNFVVWHVKLFSLKLFWMQSSQKPVEPNCVLADNAVMIVKQMKPTS